MMLMAVVMMPSLLSPRLHVPLLLQLARDIAKGMHFLHSMDPPLIHRDLKVPGMLMAMGR